MLTDFHATNTVKAFELRASDRVVLMDEIYTVTAYSVPAAGKTKLWVSPEPNVDGALPFNPIQTVTVNQDHMIALAD